MAAVKIITAGINSGKTTLLKQIELQYRKESKITAGFFSEAELKEGRKSAYYFRDIQSGKRLLAVFEGEDYPGADRGSIERFGFSRFCFSKSAFRFAETLLEAIGSGSEGDLPEPDAVFIDELGPLELSGRGLYHGVKGLLSRYNGTVYLVIRDNLLEALCEVMEIDLKSAWIIRPGSGGYHA